MLFKSYFLPLVLSELFDLRLPRKSTTCRIVKDNESFALGDAVRVGHKYYGRVKWSLGGSYAFQTGRGIPAVLVNPEPADSFVAFECFDPRSVNPDDRQERYQECLLAGWKRLRVQVIGISRHHLHSLSDMDIFKEGIYTRGHHVFAPCTTRSFKLPRDAFEFLWDSINTQPGTRYQDNPRVWRLEIEPVLED